VARLEGVARVPLVVAVALWASDDHLIDLKIAKVLTAAKIHRNRRVLRDPVPRQRTLLWFLQLKRLEGEEEDLLTLLTSY